MDGMLEILKINQKILAPFIYIAIILIGIDMLTTAVGLGLGLEESNFISMRFINMFGSFYGLIVSVIGKCAIVISPMIIYRFIEQGLKTSFLENIYWTLYTILIMIAIVTTLITDINNMIEIIRYI